jgi:chromosome partitioning protein
MVAVTMPAAISLAASLENVVGRDEVERTGERMPYVIAVWHQKGGVAKTTTALSLGSCFVEQYHETMLIDLDLQANLTVALGVDPAKVRHSAADVLLGNGTLLRISRETIIPGLDLVPSNADMLTVSRHLHLRGGYEYTLREALSRADVARYEYVVLDCPPSVGPLTVAALTAADLVIIPTQCEYFSMQALRYSLELVNMVRAKTNANLAYRVLITLFDGRGALHTRALAQLQQLLGQALFQTIIGVDSKLRESQLAATPITIYAHNSRVAQQYRQLAEELQSHVQQQQAVFQTA